MAGGGAIIDELKSAITEKERAELMLSNLEKLKAEISVVEGRYHVLKANYSELCEDAISKIIALKIDLQREIENKAGDLDLFKPRMTNLEARMKLGLVPVEAPPVKEKEVSKPWILQRAVNWLADGIEFGLDKVGDGVILVANGLVTLCFAFWGLVHLKPRKRRR